MDYQKRTRVLIAVIVVIGIALVYRYYPRVLETTKPEEPASEVTSPVQKGELLPDGSRRVTADISFDVPDGIDHVLFSVTTDPQGLITALKMEDADTHEVSTHMEEFSGEIMKVIGGKKLADLTAIDKVGRSSLTTVAFNNALDKLKAQL